MSQHDYVIDNASGASARADINNALLAISSRNSGASAPATTYAYMTWVDTANGVLKRRNAANSGWIVDSTIDESFVLARSSNTMLDISDRGKVLRATGSYTQTLDAAATLGDGWAIGLRVESGVTLVLDPNSTEQVNGATTLSIVGPMSGFLECNGTGFYTVGLGVEGTVTQSANTFLAGPGSGSAAAPTFRAPVGADGASVVLIQRQVASASAQIDFTTGIDSTYDEYFFTITDLVPATDNTDLLLRVSEDAGSSWKSGGTDYAWGRGLETDAGATVAGAGSTGDSSIKIAPSLSNSKAARGRVEFSAPSGASRHKLFGHKAEYEPSGGTIAVTFGGGVYKGTANAINGIRFLMSSGNLTSGNFALYGIRKA